MGRAQHIVHPDSTENRAWVPWTFYVLEKSSDLENQPRPSTGPGGAQLALGIGGLISSIANIATIWGWGRDATSLL